MITASLVDSSLTASISILLGASVSALILCVLFLRKSRALNSEIPEDLSVTVFDKTFNVFDVYPSHRRTLLNYAVPLFGLCVYGTIVVGSFVIMKALEMGVILSPAVFIVCLASIAVGEAFEVHSAANTFLDAMRSRKRLGRGDIIALLTVRNVLPRISSYYLLLTVFFGVAALSLPITFPLVLSAMTQIFGRIVEFTLAVGYPSFYLAPFSVAIAAFLLMMFAGKVKDRLLNLSVPRAQFDALRDTFDVAKSVTSWTGHHEGIAFRDAPKPDEIQRNEDREQQ